MGPILADAFGFAFWIAFGLTAIIFVPASFLPRRRTADTSDSAAATIA